MSETPRSPLSQRLSFYRIDPKDTDFGTIAAALDKFGDDALDKFYENVAATPETARFFANKAGMDRAHKAQVKHWQKMFGEGVTEDYFASTKVVGDVHARIGLEPRWYIGGYANILEQVITGILTEGLKGLSRRRKADARRISTLVKMALLDMDLGITRYFEVDEDRRQTVISVIAAALADVSRGDLTTTVPTLPGDYAQIEHDFRTALAHLSETFRDILEGSGQIATTASEIRAASDDLARRSEQQAARLEESAAAMDELTDAITTTTTAMNDLSGSVSRTHTAAKGGGEVVTMDVDQMC